MNNKHPYRFRLWLRTKLPWFLIDLGFADKGKDCRLVNADHDLYNKDDKSLGCYYCHTIIDKPIK